MKRTLLFALFAMAAASAQHKSVPPDPAAVPEALGLKGDPAAAVEFGAERCAPAPVRRGELKTVTWFAASCRACIGAHEQDGAAPPPPPAEKLMNRPWDATSNWS